MSAAQIAILVLIATLVASVGAAVLFTVEVLIDWRSARRKQRRDCLTRERKRGRTHA